MAINKLLDTPQRRKHTIVQSRPIIIVGFRPILSDAQPQGTAVKLWQSEKAALMMPAHLATSSCGTPKPLIISGR